MKHHFVLLHISECFLGEAYSAALDGENSSSVRAQEAPQARGALGQGEAPAVGLTDEKE